MKRKNGYIGYAIFFGCLALCCYVAELCAVDLWQRVILLSCGCVCLFLCALMSKSAYQMVYYDKAMDAWSNWYEEIKKRESEEISKKSDLPFKEFDLDDKE